MALLFQLQILRPDAGQGLPQESPDWLTVREADNAFTILKALTEDLNEDFKEWQDVYKRGDLNSIGQVLHTTDFYWRLQVTDEEGTVCTYGCS